MDALPTNAIDFDDRFRTESDCIQYLRKVRWPGGFLCPRCQHTECTELNEKLFQCTICRKQTSVTAGTIFHKTHLPLRLWFKVIFSMGQDKGGTSSSRVASQFGIPQKTAWSMLHRIRSAMAERNELLKLCGDIELDEAYINKEARKYQQAPRTETQILVMCEEEEDHAGRIFLQVLPAATGANIQEAVEFATDSEERHRFKADGWHAHHVLKRMGHDADFSPAPGMMGIEKLPWLHTFVSLLRRYLMGTYHGVSPKLLQLYLDEFVFRVNRRFCQPRIWQSLIRACSFAKPLDFALLK